MKLESPAGFRDYFMNSHTDRTIVLAIADRTLAGGLAGSGVPGKGASWMYLGRDFRMSMHLDQVLGPSMERYHFGNRLQEIARTSRQEYIDLIGGLSRTRDGQAWWLTSVSEKNPFITSVFLYACYIRLCREYMDVFPGDVLIICESGSLLDALVLNLRDIPRTRIHLLYPGWRRATDAIRGQVSKIGARSWFLLRFSGRILLARIFAVMRRHSRQGPGGPSSRVLIHSWADARAFQDPGSYTDAYFGKLGKILSGKGNAVGYVVSVLPTISYQRAVSGLSRYPEDIYLFEEFIGVPDLLSALTLHREPCEGSFPEAVMAGIDLSSVIEAELRSDRRTTRAEQSFLAYRAALRIPRVLPVSTFIYTFENHIWEKMFCAGFRRASPRTFLTGYAHSIVSPMYLSYSLSRAERETAPLPDRIAVNGSHARENLIASGFPEELVVVTGAFRYSDIERSNPPKGNGPGRTVLVPLTAGIDESLELAMKAVLALGEIPGIRLVLKPHPSISRETLLSLLPRLPPAVEINSDPVERLLDQADLVLFTSTTVAVEALGRGIPLIHVRSDLAIDRNILEGFPLVPSALDPGEIRRFAIPLLEKRENFIGEGRKAVLTLFTPAGDGSADLMLGAWD